MNDIVISEYKCKFCKKCFNLNNNKNKHELICNAKEIYFELEQTKKELELKDKKRDGYNENSDSIKNK